MVPARRMRLLWIAMFVAPLLVLAGIGLRAIHALGVSAREDARRECAQWLEKLAPAIESAVDTVRRSTPAPAEYDSTPRPTDGGKAQAMYEEAVAAPPDGRLALLRTVLEKYPDARLSSGLPLAPLIRWAEFQLADDPAALAASANALARSATEVQPSILTDELLNRAAERLEATGVDASEVLRRLAEWRLAEGRRGVLAAAGPFSKQGGASRWITVGEERWLVEAAPSGQAHAISRTELTAAIAESLLRTLGNAVEYADVSVSLAGEPLIGPSPAGDRLASLERQNLFLTAVLAKPSVLYSKQRRESALIAALLVCAVTTAGASYWTTQRALVREARLSEMKSNFVSSVSHELRAPIASIRVMAENLSSGIVSGPRQQDYHRLMAEECHRLSVMIENVLDLARIEQDRKRYTLEETDMQACLMDAVALMRPRADERRQQITLDVALGEDAPVCDGMAVQRAVVNLLDNAVKFVPEGTQIEVIARPQGASSWSIAVTDHGPGVPAAERTRIFDRFYRLGSELRRETQGAGIGLNLVKHIAESHGGAVRVEEVEGGGARFVMTLPFRPPQKTAQANLL